MPDNSRDEFSTESCLRAVESGRVVPWLRSFLSSDGSDNEDLARELVRDRSAWYGPVRVGFEHLHRLVGPERQPTLDRMDDIDAEATREMVDSLGRGWEPPPVIASWHPDHLHLTVEDGNHRIEALRRSGATEWWTLVGLHDDDDRAEFLAALARDFTDT